MTNRKKKFFIWNDEGLCCHFFVRLHEKNLARKRTIFVERCSDWESNMNKTSLDTAKKGKFVETFRAELIMFGKTWSVSVQRGNLNLENLEVWNNRLSSCFGNGSLGTSYYRQLSK